MELRLKRLVCFWGVAGIYGTEGIEQLFSSLVVELERKKR
jgi:hypothetical protein